MDKNVIAFDTETLGLDWFDGQTAFLASWADAEDQWAADIEDSDTTEAFLAALNEADVVVAHNLTFDAHQLRESYGVDLFSGDWELHDTDILARVVSPYGNRSDKGGYRLKELASVFVSPDAAAAEEEMKELAKAAGISLKEAGGYYDFYRAYPTELVRYAKQDARITYDLFNELYPMLDSSTRRCYELERAVMPILHRAEQLGIRVDENAVSELYKEYTALERELHTQLAKELGDDALGGKGSEEALLEALQMIGVPLYKTTKTGKLSTSKFALQEFEDEFPQIETLLEWRRVTKFLSTYIGPMRDRAVVHTSFRQCEAWTGRMSSARPNLQNLPKRAGREVRRPIVSREGNRLVACDFDGIEARLLAYYMNDERYKEFFRTGSDPHAWMASEIHGGEPSDFAKGTPGEAARDAAKNTLFAITYGAGGPRVADMNKITVPEAKALISKIKNSLPKYRKLMGRIRKKVGYQGYVTTLYGRKQMINKDKSYVGLNALIQGTAADVMKQAAVNVQAAFDERPDLEARMILFVHDEIVAEAPEDKAEEVQRLMCEAMEAAGGDIDPPLAASGSIGATYEEV